MPDSDRGLELTYVCLLYLQSHTSLDMAHDTTLIQHPSPDSKPSYTSDSSPPTDTDSMSAVTEATDPNDSLNPPIEWDWDAEHADREKERKADATMMHMHNGPFQVDRKLLKDVVREKMECEVGRIQFLSSGESLRSENPKVALKHQNIGGKQGLSIRYDVYKSTMMELQLKDVCLFIRHISSRSPTDAK